MAVKIWDTPKISDFEYDLDGVKEMGVSKNNGTPKSSILIGFSMKKTIHFGIPLFNRKHPNPSHFHGFLDLPN